ncbi:UNVERIFIED_CONTAM: hypothetical protein FKN15_000066 [Acipenser sinensis]
MDPCHAARIWRILHSSACSPQVPPGVVWWGRRDLQTGDRPSHREDFSLQSNTGYRFKQKTNSWKRGFSVVLHNNNTKTKKSLEKDPGAALEKDPGASLGEGPRGQPWRRTQVPALEKDPGASLGEGPRGQPWRRTLGAALEKDPGASLGEGPKCQPWRRTQGPALEKDPGSCPGEMAALEKDPGGSLQLLLLLTAVESTPPLS